MSYLKTAPKRYFWEIMAAAILLFGIVRLARFLSHSAADPALINGAKLLVLVPVIIIGLAILRLYRSRDELQQQLMLKTTAMAGLLSLLVMMAYVPLSTLGLPHFSLIIGILILSGSYILVGTILTFRQQSAVSGRRDALTRVAPLVAMPLFPAAYWLLSLLLPLPPLSFRLGMLLVSAGGLLFGFWEIFFRQSER